MAMLAGTLASAAPSTRCSSPSCTGGWITGTDALEQAWLPPEVQVQVSFIPEDEIGAVIEESIGLEPIDLSDGDLAGLAISALVPLPRHKLHTLAHSLRSLTMSVASPASSSRGRSIFSRLDLTRNANRLPSLVPLRPGSILSGGEAAQLGLWEAALQDAAGSVPRDPNGNPVIFYARQRTAPHAATLTGHSIQLVSGGADPVEPAPSPSPSPAPTPGPSPTPTPGPSPTPSPAPAPTPTPTPTREEEREKLVEEKAGEFQLKTRLGNLRKAMVAGANSMLTELLALEQMREVLFTNLIKDLEVLSPEIDTDREFLDILRSRSALTDARLGLRRTDDKLLSKTDVATVGGDYRRQELGMGLRLLAKASDESLVTGRNGVWLGDTTLGIDIDRILSTSADRRLEKVARELAEPIKDQNARKLREMVTDISGRR